MEHSSRGAEGWKWLGVALGSRVLHLMSTLPVSLQNSKWNIVTETWGLAEAQESCASLLLRSSYYVALSLSILFLRADIIIQM